MATRWAVPRMWAGKTVAILATGPSLSPAVADQVRDARLPTIAINDAYRLAPWADVLYAADASWWRHHAQGALKFPGLKVTAHESCEPRSVLLLKRTGVEGFDPDPKQIRTGGNSGYQAVHLAIHAGAERVLLMGYDMRGNHFFGRHPAGLANTVAESFARWIARFPALAGRGAEIINCTPGSALGCFPRRDLADVLCEVVA